MLRHPASGVVVRVAVSFRQAIVTNPQINTASLTRKSTAPEVDRERLVLLGSGWGATSFLKAIDPKKYQITVVSPRNYFVMTALLPGLTVGTVEPRSIIEPIRRLLPGSPGLGSRFFEASAVNIDPDAKTVSCRDLSGITAANAEFLVPYDKLIISVGAPFNAFTVPGVTEQACMLKDVEDACRIRGILIDMLETAALPSTSEKERKELCSVVVVGGGPIGVGVAAEIEDFLRQDVPRAYPELKDLPTVTIVHNQQHILNIYDKRISTLAEAKLKTDKIQVLTGHEAIEVKDRSLVVRNKDSGAVDSLPFGVCVWTQGLGTAPLTRALQDRLGYDGERRALSVDKFLRVRGADGVFALGDCADVKEGPELRDRASELFREADADNSGTIDAAEMRELLLQLKSSHPHVEPLLSDFGEVAALMRKADGNEQDGDENNRGLRREEFETALARVDLRASSHPATAQVAAQQGTYLASALNNIGAAEPGPFRYKHLGSFVQLGGSQAAMQMPGDMVWSGFSTMALWYGAYFSEQVSWRNRWLVLNDWLRVRIFGRDSSRM